MVLALLALSFVAVVSADHEALAAHIRAVAAGVLDELHWCPAAIHATLGHFSEARQSKQLNGHDPFTLLAHLHKLDGVWPLFAAKLAESFGYVVIEQPQLQALVTKLDRIDMRMVRMTLPLGAERQERVG